MCNFAAIFRQTYNSQYKYEENPAYATVIDQMMNGVSSNTASLSGQMEQWSQFAAGNSGNKIGSPTFIAGSPSVFGLQFKIGF